MHSCAQLHRVTGQACRGHHLETKSQDNAGLHKGCRGHSPACLSLSWRLLLRQVSCSMAPFVFDLHIYVGQACDHDEGPDLTRTLFFLYPIELFARSAAFNRLAKLFMNIPRLYLISERVRNCAHQILQNVYCLKTMNLTRHQWLRIVWFPNIKKTLKT